MFTTFFKSAADKVGISDFARDRSIVEKYTGALLTRLQFDQYSRQFLLNDKFGNADQVRRQYHGFGTSMESGNALIMADILRKLHSAGVTLNVGSEGSRFRTRLVNAFNIYPVQNFSWLQIPAAYTGIAEIQKSADQTKTVFPYLEKESYSYS